MDHFPSSTYLGLQMTVHLIELSKLLKGLLPTLTPVRLIWPEALFREAEQIQLPPVSRYDDSGWYHACNQFVDIRPRMTVPCRQTD
jgi:hypothetical protein